MEFISPRGVLHIDRVRFSALVYALWDTRRSPCDYRRCLKGGWHHPKVTRAVKARLGNMHRALYPVALPAEVRAAQIEFSERIDRHPGKTAARLSVPSPLEA